MMIHSMKTIESSTKVTNKNPPNYVNCIMQMRISKPLVWTPNLDYVLTPLQRSKFDPSITDIKTWK